MVRNAHYTRLSYQPSNHFPIDFFWFTGMEYTFLSSLNPISAIDSDFMTLFWPKMIKIRAKMQQNSKIHTIFNILIEKSLPIDLFWFTVIEYTFLSSINPISAIDSHFMALFSPKMLIIRDMMSDV